MESVYRKEMKDIQGKMAIQVIRKIIRGNDPDFEKLEAICRVVHDYEDDMERAAIDEERRAIEADEADMRREKINDMFDGMTEGLDSLTIHKGDGK